MYTTVVIIHGYVWHGGESSLIRVASHRACVSIYCFRELQETNPARTPASRAGRRGEQTRISGVCAIRRSRSFDAPEPRVLSAYTRECRNHALVYAQSYERDLRLLDAAYHTRAYPYRGRDRPRWVVVRDGLDERVPRQHRLLSAKRSRSPVIHQTYRVLR